MYNLLQDRDVFHDRVISSVGELVPLRSQRTAPIDCFCWSNTLDQGESTWESLLCSTSWVLLESTYMIYINCYLLSEIERPSRVCGFNKLNSWAIDPYCSHACWLAPTISEFPENRNQRKTYAQQKANLQIIQIVQTITKSK